MGWGWVGRVGGAWGGALGEWGHRSQPASHERTIVRLPLLRENRLAVAQGFDSRTTTRG